MAFNLVYITDVQMFSYVFYKTCFFMFFGSFGVFMHVILKGFL